MNNATDTSYVCCVGTLGYVMSEVEDGNPLSQVVKVAKSLGFTEPGFYDLLLCCKNTFMAYEFCGQLTVGCLGINSFYLRMW